MIISDEDYVRFINDGQKFNLEKIEDIFPENEDEVKINNE